MITNGPWYTPEEAIEIWCPIINPDGSFGKCASNTCMAWRQLVLDGSVLGYCGLAGEPASKVVKRSES